MADKRALIAATLIATGLSEYFTQDLDDFIPRDDEKVIDVKAAESKDQPKAPEKKAEPKQDHALASLSDETLYDHLQGKVIELFAAAWNIEKQDAVKEVLKLKEAGKITGKLTLSQYQKLADGVE